MTKLTDIVNYSKVSIVTTAKVAVFNKDEFITDLIVNFYVHDNELPEFDDSINVNCYYEITDEPSILVCENYNLVPVLNEAFKIISFNQDSLKEDEEVMFINVDDMDFGNY